MSDREDYRARVDCRTSPRGDTVTNREPSRSTPGPWRVSWLIFARTVTFRVRGVELARASTRDVDHTTDYVSVRNIDPRPNSYSEA